MASKMETTINEGNLQYGGNLKNEDNHSLLHHALILPAIVYLKKNTKVKGGAGTEGGMHTGAGLNLLIE